jgi:hypothetical protein
MKISKVKGGEFAFQGPPVPVRTWVELVSWGLGEGDSSPSVPPSLPIHPPFQGPVSRAGEILEGFLLVKYSRDGTPQCRFCLWVCWVCWVRFVGLVYTCRCG